MNNPTLRYADERDKCYGLTGMAITMVACDGEEYLTEINLDAADDSLSLVLGHDYGLKANPRISARIVWEQTLADLKLTTSLTLGNIACRRYVLGHRDIDRADIDAVRSAVRTDGNTHCGLDTDEADRLFESSLGYVLRIFRHAGIAEVAHSFAGTLARRRTLSGPEAVEILASLGLR